MSDISIVPPSQVSHTENRYHKRFSRQTSFSKLTASALMMLSSFFKKSESGCRSVVVEVVAKNRMSRIERLSDF